MPLLTPYVECKIHSDRVRQREASQHNTVLHGLEHVFNFELSGANHGGIRASSAMTLLQSPNEVQCSHVVDAIKHLPNGIPVTLPASRARDHCMGPAI